MRLGALLMTLALLKIPVLALSTANVEDRRRHQSAVALHSRKDTLRSINPDDACNDRIWVWMLLDHVKQ